MAIDPNIALQVKPLEVPSALDAYGKAMTLRGLVNQGALQDMQLQDAQRKQQERMTLRDVLQRSGGNMNTVVPELMKAGLPEQALAFQKQVREQQKSDLEIKNITSQISDRNWKTEKDRTQTFIQAASGPLMKYKELVASGMPDQVARQAVQPLYQQSFVSAFQSGLFDQKHMQGIPAEFDPQWAEGALSRTMTYDKVLADWRAQQTFKETQAHNRTTEALTTRGQDLTDKRAREGQAITLRGQDMTDARARETLGAGRVPTGYRYKADGVTLEPIPGGPAEKDRALTEVQGRATAFSMRLKDSDKVISEMEKTPGFDPAAITTQYAGQSGIAAPLNYLASNNAQKYEQAKRNWVTANLRLESGAVIPEPELRQEYRKWFPIPGDGPAVIAQKAAARKVAEQAMDVQSGPGQARIPKASGGIKFLGFENQ